MWSARRTDAKVLGRGRSPGSIREDRDDFLSLRSSVGGQSAGFGALWEGTLNQGGQVSCRREAKPHSGRSHSHLRGGYWQMLFLTGAT